MLETAGFKLVETVKGVDIQLERTYAKEGPHLKFKAARYAHTKQFRRMRKAIKRQHNSVGRLRREIQSKATSASNRAGKGQTQHSGERRLQRRAAHKGCGLQHILMVASTLHMPRALALSNAQDLQVSPTPTDLKPVRNRRLAC